jgi:tetratricopeptide (TPR) repeat protein
MTAKMPLQAVKGSAMTARCLSCHAPVADGVEICESCRTAHVLKVDLGSLTGDEEGARISDGDFLIPAQPIAALGRSELPFCGRAQELSQLIGLVEKSVREQRLRCALVSAPAGQGKSRLLREVARLCSDHLGLPMDRILIGTLVGGDPPSEATLPLSAFREQVRARCGISENDAAQTAREKVQRTCRSLLPPVRASEVSLSLADFLGLSPTENGAQAESERSPRSESRSYAALKRFLSADAARAPLVLLFDELEHASEETLSLLRYLSESLAELPVFIGLFARPEFSERNPDCVSGAHGLAQIELAPLSSDESVELFCLSVGCEVAGLPQSALRLIEKSEGSPRALAELLRVLVETEILTWTPAQAPDVADDEPTGGVPLAPQLDLTRLDELESAHPLGLNLRALVATRLAILTPSAQRVLERAAACGEHFYLDALLMLGRCDRTGAALASHTDGADDDDEKGARALDASDGAESTGLWAVDGWESDEELGAGTPLPPDDSEDRAGLIATLDQLVGQGLVVPVGDSRLHGERGYRFAYSPWRDLCYEQLLPARKRRYHRLLAHWLLLHRERDSDDIVEAVARHFERAAHGSGAAFFYHQLAGRASAQDQLARATRLLLRAIACLGRADMGQRVAMWHELGAILLRRGDLDAALSAYGKLLRLSHVLAVRQYRAAAYYALGQIHRHKGDLAQALDQLSRAHADYAEINDLSGIADVLDDLGQVLWLLGRVDEALDRTARALELRRRLGDRRKEATSLLHIGSIELHRGLIAPALSCYEEALRKHDEDPELFAACQEALGSVDLLRGDLAAARQRFEAGLSCVESRPGSPIAAALQVRVAEVALELGHVPEAEGLLRRARELALRSSERRLLAEIKRLLTYVHLRRDQQREALACSQQALDYAQKSGVRHEIARALLAMGEAHAATLFDETIEGQHPAWECFRRSVALLREVGDQAELAAALYQMARLLIERGRLQPARNTLNEALEIATRLRLGIAYEMQQILAEL